ncbi:hypothetical protein [Zooshikella ganghwensis]|uniref:hypothetical protein n=1 Tax=Zooshikella ganghwensis TaxID=202772 RepID=UPI00041AD9B0|nr:hypothetical protein [Zooshikella ganghwensis]
MSVKKKYALLSVVVIAAGATIWLLPGQEDEAHSQPSSLQSVKSQLSPSSNEQRAMIASPSANNHQVQELDEIAKNALQAPQSDVLNDEVEESIAESPQDLIHEAVRQAREEKVRLALNTVRQRTAQITREDIVAEQQQLKAVRDKLENIEVKPPQIAEFTDEAGIKWNKLTYANGEVKYELVSFPE